MDYAEFNALVIHRNRGEQDATDLYIISDPPFEQFDAAAIWDEFNKLFDHDKETHWMHDGFTLEEHRRRSESGASSYLWELLVEAWEQVPRTVIDVGLGVVLNRLADRLRVRNVPALDRERALNTSRWAVLKAASYLPSGGLGEPIGEEHDTENGRWTFTYRPWNGYEYVVEVGWHSRLPGVVRIGRTQIGSDVSPVVIVSGSIVERPGAEGAWVVVDITDDGLAVLRTQEDIDLLEPVAVPISQLKLVGHLRHLDGWIEESHGVWRKI